MTMQIRELLGADWPRDTDIDLNITALTTDSRTAGPGTAFFCLPGATVDGHDFAPQAAGRGASCIIHSRALPVLPTPVVTIRVDDTLAALNRAASVFYGDPSGRLTVYGVTGTNGKTTVATLLSALRSAASPTGYIGTIANRYNEALPNQPHTTPEPISLQRMLRAMVDDGLTSVAMEVSSQGLAQGRVDAVSFDVAIMTNFTHEHLDYHGTMAAYLAAKRRLFQLLAPTALAILNRDDPSWQTLSASTRARVVTYGIEQPADYRARDLDLTPTGTRFCLEHGGRNHPVVTDLVGQFNVANLLAVIAALHQTGVSLPILLPLLAKTPQVEGRVERIDQGQPFLVIVDYAHTPDGFEKIFAYAQAIRRDGEVIVVFGSAGRRDVQKRPMLGEIADRAADWILLTEEDCRDEDPAAIADEIRVGIRHARTQFIRDRAQAIHHAITHARTNDIVLILAKGNEKFLDRAHGSDPYAGDADVARAVLTAMGYQALAGDGSGKNST